MDVTSGYSSFNFFWYDYVICVLTITLSAAIGIYFGCFGSKQASVKEYLMGGKKMKTLPMAFSIAVSHLSGTTLTVVAADVFRYGASIWLCCLSYILTALLIVFLYLPVFFKLQLTSVNEYLEKRFDRKTKYLGFFLYVLGEIFRFPLLAYAPSLAFATVSGCSIQVTVFGVCAICTLYTAIGGLRTVIWSDFLQFFIIVGSLTTVYVMSIRSAGGFSTVWNIAANGQRLDIFNFDIDPTSRESFWHFTLGSTALITSSLAVHQSGVQKFLSLPTFHNCVQSIVYSTTVLILILTFCVFIGLSIYARYTNCDPLAFKKITKHDQLMAYYIADISGNLPGASGLFVATILSAALSSMSSDLNALSGVIYQDFIMLFLNRNLTEKYGGLILRLAAVFLGFVSIILVFFVQYLGELFWITQAAGGMTSGPVLGIFTLGVLFPKANAKGAFYGTLGGTILMTLFILSAKYYQLQYSINYPTKPFSLRECDIWYNSSGWFNETQDNTGSTFNKASPSDQVPYIFKISFIYYTFLGLFVTLISGMIISYISRGNSPPVDKKLLSPISQFFYSRKMKNNDEVQYSNVHEALDLLVATNN